MTELTINRRKLVSVTLLNLGALSWFFVFNNYMEEIFTFMNLSTPNWASYVGNS